MEVAVSERPAGLPREELLRQQDPIGPRRRVDRRRALPFRAEEEAFEVVGLLQQIGRLLRLHLALGVGDDLLLPGDDRRSDPAGLLDHVREPDQAVGRRLRVVQARQVPHELVEGFRGDRTAR